MRNIAARTFALIDQALGWFATNVWVYFGILWDALVVCRASVLMAAAGWLLLASEQGQDVLLALAQSAGSDEGPGWYGYPLLIVTLLFLSFWMISTWYWALTMLRFDLPRWTPYKREGSQKTWATVLVWFLPTVLGLATVAAFYLSLPTHIPGLIVTAEPGFVRLESGAGAVAVLFVFYERMHRRLLGISEEHLRRGRIADIWSKTTGRVTGRSKGLIATWVLLVTLVIGVAMLVASWAAPVTVGRYFRTDTLFFMWAGSIIPPLSLMAYFTEFYRVPILTILVGLAVLFSISNDNHVVRFLDRNAVDPNTRPTVAEAARDWLATLNRKGPPVIVATAGGGSRAAYWTATVLGRLQDCYPEFARHTFAISGVSGGSLGAAAFRAVLTDSPITDPKIPPEPHCGPDTAVTVKDGVAQKAQEVVGSDFLTATTAALLYPDLLQRFWPWPIKSADRARAIELAWEDSYRRAMRMTTGAGGGQFAGSFINAAAPASRSTDAAAKRWPALFLNATWAETGRRLIMSPFKLTGDEEKASAFPAADDLLGLIGRDIALSTAAGLSARFPIVLPAATLLDSAARSHGRAVDGGYFENYGAVTAAELLAELRGAVGTDAVPLRPVVILISSDPTLPNTLGALCNPPKDASDQLSSGCSVNQIGFAPEIRSPIRAFLAAREARGVLASLDLKELVSALGGQFAHFRLCPAENGNSGGRELPLGWALSDHAKEAIKGALTDLDSQDQECRRINRDSWAILHGAFASAN